MSNKKSIAFAFYINKFMIHTVIDNIVSVRYEFPNSKIILFSNIGFSGMISDRLASLGVKVLYEHEHNISIMPFSVMGENVYRFVIHNNSHPINIVHIRRWVDGDDLYMKLGDNKKFTFGGITNKCIEFYRWFNVADKMKNDYEFFEAHISNHILANTTPTIVKNVVSFSLWGDTPLYNEGAIHNIPLVTKFYPDWECRFYIDDTVPSNIIDTIKDLGGVVIMKDNNHGTIGSFWRFEVMFDDDVDVFIIRDADSRIYYREHLAINEWLESGKHFHIMRDHIAHNAAILAGMWGGLQQYSKVLIDVYMQWTNNTSIRTHKGCDQDFLLKEIFPKIKHDTFTHDTFKNYHGCVGTEVDFPIPLEGDYYVGSIRHATDNGLDAYIDTQKEVTC